MTIPFVACITLRHRVDRQKDMRNVFSQNAELLPPVTWFIVDKHPAGGRYGCFNSHLCVYAAALEKKVPYALVLEDDVHWAFTDTTKLLSLLQNVLMFAQTHAGEWDVVRLLHTDGVRVIHDESWPGVLRATALGTAAYLISQPFMKSMCEQGVIL